MPPTRAEDTTPNELGRLPAETLPAPGAMIGRYTVIEKVGAGGMGVVYRARDPLQREAFQRSAGADSAVEHRRIAAELADHWRARGCASLAREWSALAQ